MPAISAADNFSIDIDPTTWQLRKIGSDSPTATALPDGLHYLSGFGMAHRLPPEGVLPREQVRMVMLGWQKSDESWHLGLMLTEDLASTRSNRWCELARWPDPDHELFGEDARDAGTTIATIMSVPFQFIEPEPPPPPLPLRPLPPLPLHLGMWDFQGVGTYYGVSVAADEAAFVRSALWTQYKRRRALNHVFWAFIYAVVSVLTLTSAIGLPNAGTLLPNPHWLPYVGLLIAFGMVFAAIYELVTLNNSVKVVHVTPTGMAGITPSGEQWRIPAADLPIIYISEVLRSTKDALISEHTEMNVHLGAGKFRKVLEQPNALPLEPALRTSDYVPPAEDAVYPLTRAGYASGWQAAGVITSEILHTTAWYDARNHTKSWWQHLLG